MSLADRDTSITPEQWRASAAANRKAARDSFDRCDTDGFVSQWASESVAREFELWATLAEQGYEWDFPALYTADGKLIEGARYVETRYGWTWVYDGDGGTVWFRPSEARDPQRRLAADLKKGHTVGLVRRPAYVGTRGSGRGTSGALSVAVTVQPVPESAKTPVAAQCPAQYGQMW